MNKLPAKSFATLLTLMLLLAVITPMVLALPGDQYQYDQPGDKNYVNNTNVLERYCPDVTPLNNRSCKIVADRAQADAVFTTESVAVDGVREAAWDDAVTYPIANRYNTAMTANLPDATTEGTLRLLWDGPVLYILVEVTGDSTQADSSTQNWTGASYTPNADGLFVFMDVFNDQWGMETDTQGVFFLRANPESTSVTSFNNGGIPSLGSFFNPANQDYSTRLKAFKSSGYSEGEGVNYTYEIALQIEGWGDAWEHELINGTKVGLEVAIFNQGQSFTYWSKTQFFAGREANSNLPNSERTRNRDWGEVTLSDWDEETPFAYSSWPADENIRFWNSKSNPGGSGNGTDPANNGDGSLVWTPASKARMIAAMEAYEAIKDSDTATREEKEAAVLEVCEAFAGLRWGDTRFPDPHNLPEVHALPNIWEFFDETKGTNGMVTTPEEWAERKQELLELAQFYEYGYKPRLGVDYTINITANNYAGTGNPVVSAQVIPTNVNYAGGVPVNVNITITLPASVPGDQKAVVAFGGGYTANGIANIAFPNWAFDNRTDNGAWGNPNRTGTFYTLFPYVRNSTSHDSSILIANATAVSAYLDILEMAVAQNPALDARIDPTRAVTKGFSIGGKNAFVAAVFDERVKAVVNGGSGATGPANWRYNAQGQEYDFTDTVFYNPGAEAIVAHGTEGPGNSYRHNRVRETELFRHFMSYGHMYSHAEGSYGYGNYSRLPFDQALLVATLAPDRAIMITTNLNDYNDGSTTDNMSLQIAKSVYNTLGVNGDDFVKFNNGNYISAGDPHGAASAAPEGRYLSDFFYGTELSVGAEAERLNTDPYALPVSDGRTQSPYDYYWGGYNTITGGQDGINGTDGWYHYTLPDLIYVSFEQKGQVNGIDYDDPDILRYTDMPGGHWELFFDGSDVGMEGGVNDFALLPDGGILFSLRRTSTLPGVGQVEAQDVVRFIPTSLGENTSGTFELYFDGSDVYLTASSEGIDAVSLDESGRLILSTTGATSVNDRPNVLQTAKEDLLAFTPATLGPTTSGSWEWYLDGTDVLLRGGLNLEAVWVDQVNQELYLSVDQTFNLGGGVSGNGASIFVCEPGSLGSDTTCTYRSYWNATDAGIHRSGMIDGFHIQIQ